jgi:hypothetical protein
VVLVAFDIIPPGVTVLRVLAVTVAVGVGADVVGDKVVVVVVIPLSSTLVPVVVVVDE